MTEQENVVGKLGKFVESVDVERVLPIATAQEKRMRFEWEQAPSSRFLMNWNKSMEPNSIFIEDVDDAGMTVTVRWALMKETPEKIRELLNRWLEKIETGTFRPSGEGGRRIS